MAKLLGISMVGGCYRRGMKVSGWTQCKLEGSPPVILPESFAVSQAVEEMVRRGHDVSEYQQRLRSWVMTGKAG